MEKLKLCIVNSSPLSTSYGGVGPFIKNLDPYLKEAFDVTYVSLPESLHDHFLIPRRLMFLGYLFFRRKQFRQYDVVLSHVPEGSFALTFTKTPLVHIFHGNFNPMSQSRYWFGKYFKWIFHLFEKRIISKTILKYTVGIERPGIPKILNPIKHEVTLKPNDTRSGFIFSGRLEKIKSIDRLISVYAKLPAAIKKEHKLYIAGTGTQDVYLRSKAAELGEKENIIFLGNLSNEELIEADSNRKILVMASYQEGFPMAIAEALSVGVPVVSTDTGDIPRFLISGENGFLLPIAFAENEYRDSILAILSDYDRFADCALRSAEVFRAEHVAEGLIRDIHQALKKNESTVGSYILPAEGR